jgi:molybdenum cofactor synthesis domain-containing protein
VVPLDDARSHVLARVERLESVHVAVDDAVGLVIADPVIAAEEIPPFANSAMDGFAVRSADSGEGARLRVVTTIAAGATHDGEIGPGEAARIMTGAPMPTGADAVVMVERTRVDGDEVVLEVAVPEGNHVRPAGDDMRPGDEVLPAGVEVTPAVVGVLHTLGRTDVSVWRRPRIGVMSTGDELVDDGTPLEPGQIRDSNRPTLMALVNETGCEAIDLGLVRDDEDAIEAALRSGAEVCDVILTSGGVSMGDYDFVKAVLDRIGEMRWMQVAIRPAKPLAFGVVRARAARRPERIEDDERAVAVFGLPGNPVSSIVSFELFARPALRQMMGHAVIDRPRVRAVAADPLLRRRDGKIHFARVVASYAPDGSLVARSAGAQGSHHTAAMAAANALAVLPDGDGVEPGGFVEVFLLGRS